MDNSNTIPAVNRALEIMEYLALHSEGVSQLELKEKLGLSMSTVYRILRTLQNKSWVSKGKGAAYTIGNGILPLLKCCSPCAELLRKAKNGLGQLCAQVDMACKLSIRRGDEQLTIGRAEPAGPYSIVSPVDSSFPVIEGSVGAALLADESKTAILHLAKGCSMSLPEKENPKLILDGIASVHKSGFALNMRSNRWNVAAMSMPLRDGGNNIIAAVTLVGTRDDFTEKAIPDLANRLGAFITGLQS